MKKIIGVLLLACGLVSCSSCTGPKTGPNVPDGTVDAGVDAGVDAAPVPVTVLQDNWSLTFPNSNWRVDETDALNALREDGDTAKMTPFVNEVERNLIIVATEQIPLNTQQMALLVVRGLTDSGAKILSSKMVSLNNSDFFYIESQRPGDERVWAWVGVKSGTGYSIACGGLDGASTEQFLLCDQLASTFKVK